MDKLWIRIRYQNEPNDWMEVPMSEKKDWEGTVSPWCIKASKNNPCEVM